MKKKLDKLSIDEIARLMDKRDFNLPCDEKEVDVMHDINNKLKQYKKLED